MRAASFFEGTAKNVEGSASNRCCIMCQRPGPDLSKSEARTQSRNCFGVRNYATTFGIGLSILMALALALSE